MSEETNIPDKRFDDMIPPPEGDPLVGPFFWKIFQLCKQEKDRLQKHAKWMRNYELKRGSDLTFRKGRRGRSKYPKVPINLHAKIISQTKANLTDNKPRFEITPHSDIEQEMAPILNAGANFWWTHTKQQRVLSDTIDKSETYGSTIEKMIFDPSLEAGLGEITTLVRDPFKIFPWPYIQEVQDMPFFCDVEVMELTTMRRVFGEAGAAVNPEREWSTLLGKERDEMYAGTLKNKTATSNLPNNYVDARGSQHASRTGIKRAMAIEIWCKDYQMVEQPVIEPQPVIDPETGQIAEDPNNPGQPLIAPQPVLDETGQPVTQPVPKYPGFIRRVTIANQGKVVLADMPNPSVNPNLPPEVASRTYLWDKYPYNKCDSNSDDVNFWGISGTEQLEILIAEVNRKISMVSAHINRTTKPFMVVPKNTGIPAKEVHNLPGMLLRPNNHVTGSGIRAVEMPPLPRDIFNFIELLLKLVDILSGIHDVTEGRKPTGIAAASAIIALQEKAETIFREKIRNQDMLLEERGRMWISLSQNWYTEFRTISLSGKFEDQAGQRFLQFKGSEMQGEFSFDVVSGSTMPKSMFARREQALQLAQNGFIDQKALLDEFDFPNADEIIQRMQSGPLGNLIERLAIAMQADPAAIKALNMAKLDEKDLETIHAIGSMQDKDFEKVFVAKPPVQGGQVLQPKGDK